MRCWKILPAATFCIALLPCAGVDAQTNYDESKVPEYTLPDPLVAADGTKVTDAETWLAKRRPEILERLRAGYRRIFAERRPLLSDERPRPAELDAATIEKLRSLGYVE